MIQLAYEALRRNTRYGHEETLELLLSSEEFSGEEAQAIIASLVEAE